MAETKTALVGCQNFVRHNPKSDRFKIIDFDHLELFCLDATNASRRFATAFGMQLVARSDLDTGNINYTSYVMKTGDIKLVFTAPYWTDAPPPTHVEAFPEPTFPNFDKDFALKFCQRHGVAGRAIGLLVDDATAAYEACTKNGGTGVQAPTTLKNDDGTLVYSEVQYYEDVVLRFMQRDKYTGPYMPGYKTEPVREENTYGLERIDHIVSNVPVLLDVTNHLIKMTGMHEFAEFVAADVGTVDSGLNSMVIANNEETVLLPVNEPTFGTRRKSQIQSYIEHHRGPGVQHVAVKTNDILATIRQMRAQSKAGGVDFMPAPGASYYEDHVPKKMQGMVSQETIDECRKYGILIDRDEEGGLLQIFTKPLLDRPTLFFEIIQRIGCPLDGGKQKPACGGFGKGNFGALFKSIEDYEKMRDGEKVDNQ